MTNPLQTKRYLGILLLILHIAAPGSYARAHSTEYAVKAAFIYQFTKFIDWPSETLDRTPEVFTIGIVGKDPFKDEIGFLEGKQVKHRTVRVRYVDDLQEVEGCSLLFISDSEAAHLGRIIALAEKYHILTISDTEGFGSEGVMINLVEISKKVGFEINRSAAQRARIKISSHLLKLARIVGPAAVNP